MAFANHVAYTAPINPPDSSPTLTLTQIWPLLQRKLRAGQDFVGGAIISTDVLSTSSTSPDGKTLPTTVREVVFREGNRRVRETCVEYHPMKVEFLQTDGSKVMNVISQGSKWEEGVDETDLWMTYTFEWLHPELDQIEDEAEREKARQEKLGKERKIAKMAVENTIKVMRRMVKEEDEKDSVQGRNGKLTG